MEKNHGTEAQTGDVPYLACIHVTGYADRILMGTIYNPYFGEQPFRSTMELVLQMEEQMNWLQYSTRPGSATRSTVLLKPSGRHSHGLATFQLHIAYRQNSSWQGSLTCPAMRTSQNFRSVLELMMLLDSVLTETVAGKPLKDGSCTR